MPESTTQSHAGATRGSQIDNHIISHMNSHRDLPDITLSNWRSTRDTLHDYARLAGSIRASLAPPEKHWWHVTLQVSDTGLTTGPVALEHASIEIEIDCLQHCLRVKYRADDVLQIELPGKSVFHVASAVHDKLLELGTGFELDTRDYAPHLLSEYDAGEVERYFTALQWVDQQFRRFRSRLDGRTGPVHVFPHHFDLSMNWFSGRRVPGVDPADEEAAEEQMNFGFLSGDDSIADAYFYITAYPLPEELLQTVLPQGAYWHTQGFTGAILPYSVLRESADPGKLLLHFLDTVYEAGVVLMRD